MPFPTVTSIQPNIALQFAENQDVMVEETSSEEQPIDTIFKQFPDIFHGKLSDAFTITMEEPELIVQTEITARESELELLLDIVNLDQELVELEKDLGKDLFTALTFEQNLAIISSSGKLNVGENADIRRMFQSLEEYKNSGE